MPVIRPELLQPVNERVPVSGATDHIHLQLFHVLGVHLGIAAAYTDHRLGVQLSGPAQGVSGLFITDRRDGTGIDNVKIAGLIKPARLIAPGDKVLLQRLGFILVYLAAQGVDGKLHGKSPLHIVIFVVY